MSIANAVSKSRPIESDDETPLMGVLNDTRNQNTSGIGTNPYEITQRIELSRMASMFFPSLMVKFFYVCISVYLYGDLAIYAAAISKSLRDITCPSSQINGTTNGSALFEYLSSNITIDDNCWNDNFTRHSLYQLFVSIVLITLGPMAFFNVTKTMYLQMATTFLRWASFSSMIVLALMSIISGHSQGQPKAAVVSGLPNLFGVSVYSFMCHHSLPSLITPIRNKKSIIKLLFIDYVLILSFYLLLSFTGAFTFGESIQDIYTLNFQAGTTESSKLSPVKSVKFLEYFLPLFPVFTLSASFPIIAITLTNNLRTLLSPLVERYNPSNPLIETLINRIAFPLLAVLPPIILALFTENLQILVGIVGSYAGAMIQYVIPALLVYYSRKYELNSLQEISVESDSTSYRSPFKSINWIILVLIWSLIAIIFVTIDHIIDHS